MRICNILFSKEKLHFHFDGNKINLYLYMLNIRFILFSDIISLYFSIAEKM